MSATDGVTAEPQSWTAEDVAEAAADLRTAIVERLAGRGLELGPLHRPMARHDRMEIDYLDRFSVRRLRLQYPELADLPLIEPHLFGDAESLWNIASGRYDF